MFGWFARRSPDRDPQAEQKTTAPGRQLVGTFVDGFDKSFGLPEGFWDDPYVLGFLVTCALKPAASDPAMINRSDSGAHDASADAPSVIISSRSDNGATRRHVGEVEVDRLMQLAAATLGAIACEDREAMDRRIRKAVQVGGADFRDGGDAADKLLDFLWGFPVAEDDPDIAEAYRRIPRLREIGMFRGQELPEARQAGVALQLMLFQDAILDRFGIEVSGHPFRDTS